MEGNRHLRVGLVGPCKSGKSRLQQALQSRGFIVRHIAQEHSFAPSMWQRVAAPDVLIFLEASYEATIERGQRWTREEYQVQSKRLTHARRHANLVIDTSSLGEEEVLSQTLEFLARI